MAIFELPLRSDLIRFSFSQTLDGVAYLFSFAWNSREEHWFFDLALEDETPIWSGIKLVVKWPLGNRTKTSNAPPGFFLALDTSEIGTDPGIDELGKRVKLYYFDAASAASLASEL